jgi:hypothetical protein
VPAALVAVSLAAASTPSVKAQLASAVHSSRAGVRLLQVESRTLRLDISVRDPAAYGDDVVGPGGGRSQAWHIAPRYVDCARNLPLDDIEIDPDRGAPPCPAA